MRKLRKKVELESEKQQEKVNGESGRRNFNEKMRRWRENNNKQQRESRV